MDNNEKTSPDTSKDGYSICEIMMVIFIAFLVYYILFDNTLFKKESFASVESPSFEKIVKTPTKVSFENNEDKDEYIMNNMPHDISPEYTPELSENNDYPLLDDEDVVIKKKKSKKIKKIKSSAAVNPSDLTGGDRSLLLMNEVAGKNKKNYTCNLLGLNSADMDDFKKNYYGMYAHQIECPKKCYMNKLGMKKCNLESDKDCNGVFTNDYNNPDVYALNYMALLNNNERPCVTCTERPMSDSTRQAREDKFALLPEKMKMKDRERLQQMKVTNANLSNTVNFEDNVYLNSMGGETPVDKMAELRTCATGTCGLKDYGKSIKNVYDNLLNTPVYTNRKSCDPYQLTGINENRQLGDNYASYN